jgi:hypothetical protein
VLEVLIVIGGLVVAGVLAVWLFPLFIGVSVVAFLAWVVASITGLPFWGAVVLVLVLGVIGFAIYAFLDNL